MSSETVPELKVGDELAFCHGFGKSHWSIHKIDKITPSGRINCGQYKLDANLRVRGRDTYSPLCHRAEIVTYEIREKVRRQNLLAFIGRADFSKLDTGSLGVIYQIFKSTEESDE